MKPAQNLTILIADDHTIVRQGMSMMVKELFPYAKIKTCGTLRGVVEAIKENKYDLAIIDISFPEGNSLMVISEIKTLQPDCKILVFTAYDENIYAMRYLGAGASGYLNKGVGEDEIRKALESMVISGKYVSANIRNRILDSYITKVPSNPLEKLSPRELEVARLLVKGHGNFEISEMLQIKHTTVSTFKSRMFEKLEIDSLAALIELFHIYSDEK